MIIRRLARLLGPDHESVLRRYLWLMLVCCIVQGLTFVLVVPIMQALLVGDPGLAAWWLLPLALGTIMTWSLNYVATLRGFQVAITLLEILRHRIGEHVVSLPLGWFTPLNAGRLGLILSQGVMDLLGLPAHQLTPLMRATVTPLVVVVAMAFFDWRLAAMAAIIFPAIAVVYWWAGRLGRAADRAVADAAAEAGDRMVEFAQNQVVLRAYGCGERGYALFDAALVGQSRANRRQLWLVLPPLLANSWLAQLSFLTLMAGITWLAIGNAYPGHLVTLIAMLVLINRVVDPLTEVASYSAGIRMATAQMEAVEAILIAEPLPVNRPVQDAPTEWDVELDQVGFSYQPGKPVLDAISLRLPANTTTALLGTSGSGKSTILQLIARFSDPDSGTVRIGGVDLRQLESAELMRLISPVFQDTYLFSGTLRDNVLLGRLTASEQELQRAAELARLDDVIARLPAGWESPVGERGSLLSGGERQRVCIARALLKDAPILLLDEAASGLDGENQSAFTEGLRMLHGRKTLLVITHQLDAIRTADQIVVLDNHRIVEQGTHPQLLAADGRYAAFWRARSASAGWRLHGFRNYTTSDRSRYAPVS
ncbi:ABC transporter ATP-binding protein [Bradyrhizobium sp. 2S1]|uniref:ABC transporter ATP-binding protein n=1 Tax=Bradyrhizobium sp. 2S1 TaxID=1404429 RepID=UPI00140BC20C|nr:ABC transporter ATP-binding protein [Bradyrhizobium sp. 2S1]MCK7673412.1 ABC transporter ATP-binding protein/permease [Bradyrhizobium sp. 2S1]